MSMFLTILVLVSGLALIIAVALQDSKTEGLSAMSGASSEALFGKAKGKTKEYLLRRVTVVSAVIFMVSTLILAALK